MLAKKLKNILCNESWVKLKETPYHRFLMLSPNSLKAVESRHSSRKSGGPCLPQETSARKFLRRCPKGLSRFFTFVETRSWPFPSSDERHPLFTEGSCGYSADVDDPWSSSEKGFTVAPRARELWLFRRFWPQFLLLFGQVLAVPPRAWGAVVTPIEVD